MVLLLAKNSEAGCLFRSNFLKQVVIEIQKMEHPHKKFSKYPSPPPPEEGEEESRLGIESRRLKIIGLFRNIYLNPS